MLANELGNLLNTVESLVAVDCRAKQISVTFSNRNIQSVNDMKNICIGNDSQAASIVKSAMKCTCITYMVNRAFFKCSNIACSVLWLKTYSIHTVSLEWDFKCISITLFNPIAVIAYTTPISTACMTCSYFLFFN